MRVMLVIKPIKMMDIIDCFRPKETPKYPLRVGYQKFSAVKIWDSDQIL